MSSNSLKPLTLHAHATGPNPIKIALALEFLSLPYTIKMWQFGDDPATGVKGPAYTRINPNGRVPALEDPNTGVVSWESGACMNYLLRVYDQSGKVLGPVGKGENEGLGKMSGEQDQVDMEKWEYFLMSTLGPFTGQVNWFKHYHPTPNPDAQNRYIEQTYRCYSIIEPQLAKSGGKSILPGGMTAADLHFLPWIKSHAYGGLSLDDYPNLKKWNENMGEIKEVKEAYRKMGEAPKPGQ